MATDRSQSIQHQVDHLCNVRRLEEAAVFFGGESVVGTQGGEVVGAGGLDADSTAA